MTAVHPGAPQSVADTAAFPVQVSLHFDLHEEKATVKSELHFVKNFAYLEGGSTDIVLNGARSCVQGVKSPPLSWHTLAAGGEALCGAHEIFTLVLSAGREDVKLVSLKVDGHVLDAESYQLTPTSLTISNPPPSAFKVCTLPSIASSGAAGALLSSSLSLMRKELGLRSWSK